MLAAVMQADKSISARHIACKFYLYFVVLPLLSVQEAQAILKLWALPPCPAVSQGPSRHLGLSGLEIGESGQIEGLSTYWGVLNPLLV